MKLHFYFVILSQKRKKTMNYKDNKLGLTEYTAFFFENLSTLVTNQAHIDENKNFSSADVYSFYIKEEFKEEFSYEYLVGLLNSHIYDKYFKMIGKNMGNKIYDYYPNKVMKLKIFKDDNYSKVEALSKKIISIEKQIGISKNKLKLQGKNNILNKEIYYLENESHFLQNKINELINKSLNL